MHGGCIGTNLHARECGGYGSERAEYASFFVQLLVDIPVVPSENRAMQPLSCADRIDHDD